MDAANIDLKAFSPDFYHKLCGADLAPVLDTIQYVRHQTRTWLELTTLLIPGQNDSREEIDSLSEWVLGELGPDVPLHFSAFHPDYRLHDTRATPPETCRRAREQAMDKGLRYVYTGNISDASGQTTFCPTCKTAVIARDGYQLRGWRLSGAHCERCGGDIPGRFTDAGPSDFGSRRLAVRVPSAPAHR
jgi:pyruvate formate lyase activating enzyme